MKKNRFSRRNFLQKSALAAAAITIVPRHVLGGKGYIPPSDTLNMGFIGTGKQGTGLLGNFIKLPGVHVIAGCDVDQNKRNRFKERTDAYYKETTGNDNYSSCLIFSDYQELLTMDEIDCVVIATPDHWHTIPSVEAMKAGKDVFCEKPLAHTLYEGREIVKTATKQGRVFQTGSMQRSWPDFRKACELVQNGYVGEISKVIVNVGDPAIKCELPAEPQPDYLDWERWVGPAPMRPYNQILSPPIEQDHFPLWRDYREYGGGILADWGAHMFDIAQWGLDMDESGPVKYIPPEDPAAKRGMRMIYANGVEMVHEDFDRGWAVRFIGTEGSLDISRSFLDSKPERIAQTEIKSSDKRLYVSENHYQDWIDAIINRTKPVAHAEIGHRTSSICNIANISYQLHRELDWDPVKERFIGDSEANKLRTKEYRKPYTL